MALAVAASSWAGVAVASGSQGISVVSATVPAARLTVQASGPCWMSPNYSNAVLKIGRTYHAAVLPGKGFVFSNWVGTVLGEVVLTANTPALTFVMRSNLVLRANIISNPFVAAAGVYQGLFYNTNGVEQASSGFFSGSVSSNGSFSAKVQLGGKSLPFSGQLPLSGAWSTRLDILGTKTTVQLQINPTGDAAISGILSNSNWSAVLWANRAVYSKLNPAPQAGRYTLVLPGNPDVRVGPAGHGYGSLLVGTDGDLTFSGTLGDGARMVQSAFVSAGGQWPVYFSSLALRSSLLGWLAFTNESQSDLEGTLDWIRPERSGAGSYPAGFTNQVDAIGARYVFTNGLRSLDLTNGLLMLDAGNLRAPLSATFELNANGVARGSNGLGIMISNSTGIFQGTMADPATGRSMKLGGAILLKHNTGYGLFLGPSQTGRAYFGPVLPEPLIQTQMVTITFDGPPSQPPGTAYAINQYVESNMLFKPFGPIDTEPPYRLGRNGGGISFSPDDGTAYLQTLYGDSLEFYALDGSPFDLVTVDLAVYSIYFGSSTVTFRGLRADGSTVSETMYVNSIGFQTFYFNDSFTDVVEVKVADEGYSLDNLTLLAKRISPALLPQSSLPPPQP